MRNSLVGSPLTAVVLSWLALQACSGSSTDSRGGPSVAAADADVAGLCSAICERSVSCEPLEFQSDTCEPDCRSDNPPKWLRRDIVRGLADCQSKLSCDDDDDDCLPQVLEVLEPNFMSSPLLDRCIEVQDQCGGFSDDACAYAIVFTDAGKERMQACLNSDCDLVAGCIANLREGN